MGLHLNLSDAQRARLNSAPALDEPNDQNNYGDHEQNVDVATERIAADETKQPKNEKYDEYRPEHGFVVLPEKYPGSAAACFTDSAAAHMVWCE